MILRSYGSTAVLVELDDAEQAATVRARLEADPPVGMIETMPGLHTVLIRFDATRTGAEQVARAVQAIDRRPRPADVTSPAAADVVLRVDYSGADLPDVAGHTGLSVDEVVAAHQTGSYRIVLIGMAPGFYFLAGGDSRLHVPRRPSPRTDVPKGALGLAGDLSGIYPRLGPGGWQLIGRVLDDLWHSTAVPAALLAPGTSIRFAAA